MKLVVSNPTPNSDRATEELGKAVDNSRSLQRLWVADEHPLSDQLLSLLADRNIHLISNRQDQVNRAHQAGVRAAFNDFDLKHPDNALWDCIFFRVAKEKAVVHQVISSAAELLRDRGTLWLAGHKDEGTKTYLAKAEDLFGCKAMVKRGKEQLYAGHLDLYKKGQALPDDDYHQLRQMQMKEGETYWTKPGLFGWKRIDQGSEFLSESLTKQLAHSGKDLSESRVLDLGCGYGYLGIKAAELGAKEIVATDNCAAAILACRQNLSECKSESEPKDFQCIASDCADEVRGKFDLILCNPPFHSGFSSSSELHLRFIGAIKKKLKPEGQALVVVNQFLRLQGLCDENGLIIVNQERDSQRHFDLYRLALKS